MARYEKVCRVGQKTWVLIKGADDKYKIIPSRCVRYEESLTRRNWAMAVDCPATANLLDVGQMAFGRYVFTSAAEAQNALLELA